MMKIEIKKKFLKELSKIPNEYSTTIEKFIFETLSTYDNLSEIGKVEKMTGYKNYFKIRFGDYRIGIKKQDDIIIIETIKHRKEIYKYFP